MIFRIIKKRASNLIYKILLLHVYTRARYENILLKNSNFLIVVIAFNNPEIIKTQYKFLSQNLGDNFDYLIADNSNDILFSDKIKQFCHEKKISYIRLPKNPLSNIRASGSHGIALNWCYKNIIKKFKPKYFGLLDHDVLPLFRTNILGKIQNGFWGVVRTKKEIWRYPWPGFSFFEFERASRLKFNFFPYHASRTGLVFLDTGGANYKILKKIGLKDTAGAKSQLIDLNTRKEFVLHSDSSRTFEIIDNAWLHLRQISWREESTTKMSDQQEMINLANDIIKSNGQV